MFEFLDLKRIVKLISKGWLKIILHLFYIY